MMAVKVKTKPKPQKAFKFQKNYSCCLGNWGRRLMTMRKQRGISDDPTSRCQFKKNFHLIIIFRQKSAQMVFEFTNFHKVNTQQTYEQHWAFLCVSSIPSS